MSIETNFKLKTNMKSEYKIIYSNFSDQFIEGLKKYNLDSNKLKKLQYRFCGGNMDPHIKRFKSYFGKTKLPSTADKCVCGTDIEYNFYIIGTDNQLLKLGECCISDFAYAKCEHCINYIRPGQMRCNYCNTHRYCTCDNHSCEYCILFGSDDESE